jgi:hypothetical protein
MLTYETDKVGSTSKRNSGDVALLSIPEKPDDVVVGDNFHQFTSTQEFN